MNKNLFKWMFLGLLSFAAVTFVGCKEDDTQDLQMPTLSVSVPELTFDEEGGRQVVDIASNSNWTVKKSAEWIKVTPAAGSNNGSIEVSVEPTTVARSGKITFELSHPEWGKWGDAEASISVKQSYAGQGPITEAVYANNFDKEKAEKAYGDSQDPKYPYLDQFDGWKNGEGSGNATVDYSYNGMSARSNSESNGSYSDYAGSGVNNLFFGSNAWFKVENITLPEALSYQLTFGAEKYSQDNGSVFSTEEFTVILSADGVKWSQPLTLTHNIAEARWNVATANFTLPEGTSTLYIKFAASVASSYRLDDVKLVVGEGGETIAFTEEETTGGELPDVTEGPYTSDAAFVATVDDSGKAFYSLGATKIGEEDVTGFKLGKSKNTGVFTSSAVGVEGEKYLSFYAVGWTGKTVTLYVKVGDTVLGSYDLKAHAGATGNAPFTALSASADYFTSVKLTGLTADTKITFSTSADFASVADDTQNCRAIVFGVKLTDTEVEPTEGEATPEETIQFTKVTTMAAGTYAIVAEGKAATALENPTYTYSYLDPCYSVTDTNGVIEATEKNAFVFEAVEGGYTIKQYDGRYLAGPTGTYTSVNFMKEPTTWTVEAQADGTFKIALASDATKVLYFNTKYGSYGVYGDSQATYVAPSLYLQGEGGSTKPELTLEGDGLTVETAYTLADLQALYNDGQNPTGVWVKGTIAGYYDNALVTDATKFKATNLALQTGEVVVPVQLPTGDIRTALNLVDNPTNLNKEVAIKGNIEGYFSVAGLKSPTEYQFIGGSVEPTPDPVASEWVISGSINNWGQSTILYVEGEYVVAKEVALTTTDAFKIRTATENSWLPQYGADKENNGVVYYTNMQIPVMGKTADSDPEPGNISVSEEGTYDIYFDAANKALYVMTVGKTPADAKAFEKYNAPVDLTGTAWFLAGSMTDWANGQIAATVEGDYAVVKDVEMAAGAEFKFKAETDWNNSYGTGSTLEVGVPTLATLGGSNCKVAEAGTYDVSLGLKNAMITITKSEVAEPEPELAQGPFTSQWPFVLSAMNSTNGYSMTKSDGTKSTVNGLEASGFKLGTGSKAGFVASQPINVAGDNTLSFYALAWNGKSATLYVRVDGGAATSFELASNVGVANSEPYTITDVYTTSKYTMELTGLTAESVIEFSTSANFTNDSNSTSGRAVVFGVNLENAPADLPEPEYTKVTLAEATEDGVKYEVEATVAGKNNVSLLIADATGTTLVYLGAGKTGSYTIGDTVTVQGEMETYYKLRQFKSTSLVTVKAAGTYNYPAVTEATAEMINAYDNNKAYDYVAVTGTLASEVSGSYTNYYLTVEGANGRVQVYRPLSDQETELKSLDGHNVTVTGYFVGTFKDGSTYFPNLMMLQIQDNGQAEDGGDSGDDTTGGEGSGDGDQGGTTTGAAVTLDFASLSAVTGTVDGVTFESIKNAGNAPAYNANSKELRIYRYNGLNISAEKNIAKIEITFSSASYMGYEFNTTNGGTYTADSATLKGTWTGSQTAVNFLNNGDADHNVQARIKSIVVTFAE